jgi:hypothetical protein
MINGDWVLPDLECVCRLDDDSPFYEQMLLSYVGDAAARYLGLLYIISRDGDPLAGSLLKQCDNVDEITHLFLKYRELDAEAGSLFQAYITGDQEKINSKLVALYALLAPSVGGFSLGPAPLTHINLGSDKFVHFPLLGCTAVPSRAGVNLGQLTEMVLGGINGGNEHAPTDFDYRKGAFTLTGIRVSRAAAQPLKAGDEFQIIESGQLPSSYAASSVCEALDHIASLDESLCACLTTSMKLVTVVPRHNMNTRKSSSVSSLPGWAWQDVDLESDRLVEHCHLCMQLVHEFFHTKVNLLEKGVRLYVTDGNSPEVFSPWKNRKRPLRQVVHALVTFCAGAITCAKLITAANTNVEKLYPVAEACWTETIAFSKEAHRSLTETRALTSHGKLLVDTCIDNLHSVVRSSVGSIGVRT